MRRMMVASLVLNILVLIPVTLSLVTNASYVSRAFGEHTPGRSILLSVYFAILLVSVILLFVRDPRMVAALILVQIIYKVITPFAVGTLGNPVVLSNLGIAAFHLITLVLIWRNELSGAP